MKILLKYIFLPILLILVFNFLDYGWTWDRWEQFVYPIVFAVLALINFFIPKLRKTFITISFLILGIMVIVYLYGDINLANLVGSFGFALFCIVIISYIPTFFKNGFIEQL